MDSYLLPLSNLLTMLLTAWIIHRSRTNQSPIPSLPALPRKQAASNHDDEPVITKGRPIL